MAPKRAPLSSRSKAGADSPASAGAKARSEPRTSRAATPADVALLSPPSPPLTSTPDRFQRSAFADEAKPRDAIAGSAAPRSEPHQSLLRPEIPSLPAPWLRRDAVETRSPRPTRAASPADSRNMQYRQNWSQVVLGTTSGLMFVLVVCLSYALYILITPYYYSITSAVLLSIVMHPQSRLRSVLYTGTAVERMRRVQQRWAARGRLAGILGSWISLRHFASFVVMQWTFFLGLNKIRVASNSILLGCDVVGAEAGDDRSIRGASALNGSPTATRAKGLAGTASAGESRAASPPPAAQRPTTQQLTTSAGARGGTQQHAGPAPLAVAGKDNCCLHSGDASSASQSEKVLGSLNEQGWPAPLNASIVLSPRAAASSSPNSGTGAAGHRRLVATARGRRVLRYVTVCTLLVMSVFLGVCASLVLLHIALGVVFAVVVPFLSPEAFVHSMGRLWRGALAVLFMVSLALSLAEDVMSISDTVRRTTTAVVRGGGGSKEAGGRVKDRPSTFPMNLFTDVTATPAVTATTHSKDKWELGQDMSADASLLNQVRSFVAQQRATMFSSDNLAEMQKMLVGVLPLPLQSTLRREAVAQDGKASPTSSMPSSTSLKDAWANIRSFCSIDSLKTFMTTLFSKAHTSQDTSSSSSKVSNRKSSKGQRLAHAFAGGSAASTAAEKKEEEASMDLSSMLVELAPVALRVAQFALPLFAWSAVYLLSFFDSIYASILFVLLFRYLTQLEHTVLYYAVAKLLRVLQPEVGDIHARNIERDITVSFITLLQSFWHLTWFHFCVTFCVFQMWGFSMPFLLGLVSVVLALFPLVPKWLSPCSIALAYLVLQLVSLTPTEEGQGGPPLVLAGAEGWPATLVLGKPFLLFYARILSFGVAMLLECGDEWLLCVSRGLRGGFVVDAAGKGREQLPPFVIGTSVVLGFVTYGIRGIVFGPLTVIVARVLFDNWDIVLPSRELAGPPSPPPTSLWVEEEGEAGMRM